MTSVAAVDGTQVAGLVAGARFEVMNDAGISRICRPRPPSPPWREISCGMSAGAGWPLRAEFAGRPTKKAGDRPPALLVRRPA